MTAQTQPWPKGITQEAALDILLEYAAMVGSDPASRKVLMMAFDDWRLGEPRQPGTSIPESDLETRLSACVMALREVPS
jgi:hypothetical protein